MQCWLSLLIYLQNGTIFERMGEELLSNSSIVNTSAINVYFQNCYDATWILAMALNESITGNSELVISSIALLTASIL